MRMTYQVMPLTPEAAPYLVDRGRLEPCSMAAPAGAAARRASRTFQGTRVPAANWALKGISVPAASLTQRLILAPTTAPTTDIRGVVVFNDGVSGSRKWRPPV